MYIDLFIRSMGAFLLSAGTKGNYSLSLQYWFVHISNFWGFSSFPRFLRIRKMLLLTLYLFLTSEGKRYSLPNSRIMIHQPLGGFQGGQSDIEIQV